MANKEKKLRSGYTTGACAAAAARGAAAMLRQGCLVEEVELELPAGFTARFPLGGQVLSTDEACCFVVKDAGDDPDVTDGVEVYATVVRKDGDGFEIRGGDGVGTVTKPGLPVAIGEPAINPVPRQMIEQAVRAELADGGLLVTISIPDGEKRAERTLNGRLGIIGGLSILGTTGVVRPVSHRAWTDTIDVAIDVALAGGSDRVVLVTGRTSERAAQKQFDLPDEAYVMMGDHVGYALEACHRKGVPRVVIAAQFAKLLKIACGHRQTHVHSSELDLTELAAWVVTAGLDAAVAEKIECANTAREVVTTLPEAEQISRLVAKRALRHLAAWGGGVPLEIVLIDYHGEVAGCYPSEAEKDL